MNNSQNKKSFFLSAAPLLLVLFIDGMGLGLVFPILNGIITENNSGFFLKTISPAMHNIIFGFVIGIFMLCWFFGAAILGDLSDQIGRKKSLLICLLGSFFGYVISAIAIFSHSLTLLIIGRIIAGFTSGSQPIAQAAIIDLSDETTKARNIGYILFAISLGFVFGPLLGGIFSDHRIVSWFDFSTPFLFAAFIALINILFLLIFFKETFPAAKKINIRLSYALSIIVSAFKHEKVKKLSIIFFIFILGWSSFYSFAPLVLAKLYNFHTTTISLYMTTMGIGFGIANGFLIDVFTKRFALIPIVIVSLSLSALLTLLMLIIDNAISAWLLVMPIACVIAVAYSVLITLFSNLVSAQEQGWVMGITGAIMAFVFGVDGIIVGYLANFNIRLPIIITVIMLFIAAMMIQKHYKSTSISYSSN